MQKEAPPKPAPQKIDYECASKKSTWEAIKEPFPKQLIPTKKTCSIFGLIFIIVLIASVIQFPFNQILSGNLNITMSVGYPWHFLELNLSDTENSPILPTNLILDLILYIILAYIIDIILNLMLKNPLIKSKEQPEVFKN